MKKQKFDLGSEEPPILVECNSYKGRSLEELAADFPEYLEPMLVGIEMPAVTRNTLDHERLVISEMRFD
jgi:hypothetical protein